MFQRTPFRGRIIIDLGDATTLDSAASATPEFLTTLSGIWVLYIRGGNV